MKEIRYLAYFKGKGYYADKQPFYSWSLTEDINKAKRYKTKKGALNRIGWECAASKCSTKMVFIEEIETIKEGNVVTIKSDIIGKLNIKKEGEILRQKKIEKYRKEVGEKTMKLVNEPLKVNVEKLSADDSFWD